MISSSLIGESSNCKLLLKLNNKMSLKIISHINLVELVMIFVNWMKLQINMTIIKGMVRVYVCVVEK